MLTRRDVVKLGSMAGMALASSALRLDAAELVPHLRSASYGGRVGQQPAPPAGPFKLPPLPYGFDALEPHIDAQTMEIHHDRHHAAYVNDLNTALAKEPELAKQSIESLVAGWEKLPESVRTVVRNNGGGHLNHTLFWPSMRKGGGSPTGELAKAIAATFGSFTKFQDGLTASALGTFGSGWAWLSADKGGKLLIESTPNQDNPLTRGNTPLLGIDVWEHAYYLKHQNRRPDYVKAWFQVINWDAVAERFAALKKA